MIRSALLAAVAADFMYEVEREKKATSDPETSAELNNKRSSKNSFAVSNVSPLKTK